MKIPVLLFLLVFGVGVFVSPMIGAAWDEQDTIYVGGTYWKFFQSGFDKKVLDSNFPLSSSFDGRVFIQPNASYPLGRQLATVPPFPAYVGTILSLFENPIIAYHWASSIFFGLLVATVFRFGIFLGLSNGQSLFAALTTWLYPSLFGHGYSYLKDSAQVSLFVLALLYLVRGERGKGAFAWGLALATKFNAIYVPVIWGIYESANKRIYEYMNKKFLFIIYHLSFIIAIGGITAVALWPYLWFDPVVRVTEVVRYFTSVGRGFAVFWNGEIFRVGVGQSLWWYPWGQLLVNTPIPMILLGAIGVIRAIRERKKYGILLIWFVVPLTRTMSPTATFYDGLRHFLEVLPAFMLLSAVGLGGLGKFGRLGMIGVVAHLIFINVSLFPYSSGYYNMFAPDPNSRFERDFSALSVRESMDYLHSRYTNLRVWSPIGGHLAWYVLEKGDTYVYSPQEADSIILVNKSSHIRRTEFEKTLPGNFFLDHTIARGNSVFAWIYRKR